MAGGAGMADGDLRLHVWQWARGDLTHARVAAVVVVDLHLHLVARQRRFTFELSHPPGTVFPCAVQLVVCLFTLRPFLGA